MVFAHAQMFPWFFLKGSLKRFSGNKLHKLTKLGLNIEKKRLRGRNRILLLSRCPATPILIHVSLLFSMGLKGEIFKPFKSNQPCAYGVCSYPKSFPIFLEGVTQVVFREWVAQFDQNWAKKVHFSKISNPSNQTNHMNHMPVVFAQAQVKFPSGFLGISCISWPKLGQKDAIYEIFKPFKLNQLFVYGVCASPKNFSNYFEGVTQTAFWE